jgi:hypothetical protein
VFPQADASALPIEQARPAVFLEHHKIDDPALAERYRHSASADAVAQVRHGFT